jgi:hypothetical protein
MIHPFITPRELEVPKRSKIKITDQVVKYARSGSNRYEIRDAELSGFMLRVNLNGTKSWYVQLNRTQKRKIGDAGMMTAAVARYRARDFLASNSVADYSRKPLARSIKLSQFLLGRYANWKSSQSRWAQRDIHRLCSALSEPSA